jgi:ABC-type dipeptide/oligopeptide/nickel transport system permease subunit
MRRKTVEVIDLVIGFICGIIVGYVHGKHDR